MLARLTTIAMLALTACVARYAYPPLVARPATIPELQAIRDVRVFTATGADTLEHHDVNWK